jgi:hypothetical protein
MFDRYLVGRLERQQESVRDLADEVADVFLVREPIEARIDADGAKRLRVFGKTFRLEPCPGNLAPVFIAFGGVKLTEPALILPRTGTHEDVPGRKFAEALAERCERRHATGNLAHSGRRHWGSLEGKMRSCTAK